MHDGATCGRRRSLARSLNRRTPRHPIVSWQAPSGKRRDQRVLAVRVLECGDVTTSQVSDASGRVEMHFLVPSPQMNINEIKGVQNTNHAPATMLRINNI